MGNSEITRREFLSATALAMLPFGCPLWATGQKPILKIGFLTDTHVCERESSCDLVRGAMRIFREQGCAAVVHCGDLADLHYENGYRNYRAAVDAAFPPDLPTRPDFLYVHANHDIIDPVKARDPKQSANRFMDPNEAFAKMDRLLHDAEQPHFVSRVYDGFPILVFPQDMRLVGGYPAFEEKVASACRTHPGKPVIVCVHIPAKDTTYNSGQWGNWTMRKILDKYPQVVCFGGHVHNSLRNDLCIWQGNFTAVDVGCLQEWHGITFGTPVAGKNAYEVIVTEFLADSSLRIRRFDVRDGSEISPLAPWTVPLRRDPERPGAFAAGAQAECLVDAVPFSSVRVRFPTVANAENVIHYRIVAERKVPDGWTACARCDVYGEFYLRPQDRKGVLEGSFSDGYFDGGDYRFTVTPIGFFGTMGHPLEVEWKMPAKRPMRTVWSCGNPMEELKFRTGWTHNAQDAAKVVDVTVRDGWVKHDGPTWAVLPMNIWQRQKGVKLRLTADLRIDQNPASDGATVVPRAMDGSQRRPCMWITVPPDAKGVFRAVFDFTLKTSGVPYDFGIMQGDVEKFRIESLKLEEM